MSKLRSMDHYLSKIPTAYNVDAVRDQFPGLLENVVSLNNGAGSLVYGPAIDVVVETMKKPQIQLEGGDDGSDRDISERRSRYQRLAAYINAEEDEIAFGLSTTALQRYLTLSLRPSLNSDSEIIVSTLCHEAGITAWVSLAKSLGIAIKWWAPPRKSGETNPKLSLETLKPLLSPKTRLVTCGHVNNVLGSIHDIRKVADLVHTIPGALVSVDGVAWAPHRPVDVKALDIDFYVFSWYKVFGPHIALMYARRSVHQRYLSSLNHFHLASSTLDTKLAIGTNIHELENCLLPIMSYLKSLGWENIARYEQAIAQPLLDFLNSYPDRYVVYGERSNDPELRVSCISFEVTNVSSEVIAAEIHRTSTCRVVWGDNYSVMTVHDILGVGSGGLLRVSLVHYNTVEEVFKFINALHNAVETTLSDKS